MKSKIENKTENNQEITNYLILTSGFCCFLSLLAFCICMMDAADKSFIDEQPNTNELAAKYSVALAVIFGATAITNGIIYLREVTHKGDNDSNIIELSTDLFAEPGEMALTSFVNSTMIGEDTNQNENQLN